VTFKPHPSDDRWASVFIVMLLGFFDVLLVRFLLARPVDGLSFVVSVLVLASIAVIVYVAYRVFGTFSIEYWVDRDAVTLIWGSTRQVVPLGRIQRVAFGQGRAALSEPRIWHWPCPHRRRLRVAGLGTINSYSTLPIEEQVILVTDGESYSVSPEDRAGFLKALQQRYGLGVARSVPSQLKRPPLWTWPLWRDRTALSLILLGMLGVLVMFGALTFRFPNLSDYLPLHFDVNGLPDRIAAKSELFLLPIIGLIVWLFNTGSGVFLYRHVQRGSAYLMWLGALAVQGIAGLALFNLMRW
jgi:hypothetical protein